MKRLALGIALAAALLLPAVGRAGTSYGVTEDAGKYSSDGGASFFAHLRDLGMTENAVSVQWNPDRPTVIEEKNLLDRMVPTAARYGIRIVFAVYFTRPNAVTATPEGSIRFAAFLRTLARAYPQVKDFVVGNEPNYGLFWQPQFDSAHRSAAGAAYEDLLARSYDALKGVDPRIDVIGLGLAARGNDDASSGSPSTSPVLFLRDLGAAYRRSGRTRPLMDALAYHPYPASSLDSVTTRQGWPNAGVADLARVKQALWDAFHDTAQATFETGLALKITEIGWQAGVPAVNLSAYHGGENVRTVDEPTQARIYADLVRQLACDPAVTDVLFFHLVDESDLRGFQSGLIRADGTLRPSYGAVRSAIAQTGGRCTGTVARWSHEVDVTGAEVSFGPPSADGVPSATATADEAAVYSVALVRVDGAPTDEERASIERSLTAASRDGFDGQVPPYGHVQAALATPGAGTYVEAVLLSASTNAARTSFFLSAPFTLGSANADSPRSAPVPASNEATPPPTTTPAQGPQYAVTVTSRGAKRNASVSYRFGKHKHVKAAPTSFSFKKLPKGGQAPPGSSELVAMDGGSADGTSSPRRPLALDPHQPATFLPWLFALLLAGAAVSAVVSIRLLSR